MLGIKVNPSYYKGLQGVSMGVAESFETEIQQYTTKYKYVYNPTWVVFL